MRALPVSKLHLVDEDAVGDTWWKLSSQPELLQQLMVQADHGDSNEPECVQFTLEKTTLLSLKPFLALLQPPSFRPLL